MSAPVFRPRLAGLALWISLLGCGGGSDAPPPPRPALEGLDVAASQRIDEAVAKVEAERGSDRAWGELGMVYDSERLRTLALECFDVAARLGPRQPRWPYRSAVTLAKLGRTDEAVAAIERSLALEPGYPPSHYRLGLYRLESGDLGRAEAAFRKATELDSVYPGGWIGLARVHLQRDENEAAIEILERLARQEPDDTTVRQLRSNAYRQAGRETEFEPGEVLADEDVPVWNDPWELESRRFRRTPTMLLVGQALTAGRPEEALALLERARAEGASPEETTLHAANAHLALGRLDEAQAEIDGALRRQPKDVGALMVQVRIRQARGDDGAALDVLRRVTELSPSYGGAWAARAGLEITLGDAEQALASVEQAVRYGVAGDDVQALRLQALMTLGRWPEVQRALEPFLATHPDDGQAWAQLALARNKQDDVDGARAALERARANEAPAVLLRNVGEAIDRKAGAQARRAREDSE